MTLKLITAPATEPVTLAEAKVHLRCGDDEDALLGVLIQAAREHAEHQLGRALITQTWERVIDDFPAAEIELGMPPVASITQITYIDEAGDEQTLSNTLYTLDADTPPGWALPAEDADWPDTLDTANAVRVRYTAGYGAAATDVPQALRMWIALHAAAAYQAREAFNEKPLSINPALDGLIDPYRVLVFR